MRLHHLSFLSLNVNTFLAPVTIWLSLLASFISLNRSQCLVHVVPGLVSAILSQVLCGFKRPVLRGGSAASLASEETRVPLLLLLTLAFLSMLCELLS